MIPEIPDPGKPPGNTPEEPTYAENLPSWQMLSFHPAVWPRKLPRQAVQNQALILSSDEGDSSSWYRYIGETAEIGDVYARHLEKNSWTEVVGTVDHEHTHAQHPGDIGADLWLRPIENEYWADIVALYVFPDNGRKDLIDENWSDLFYDNRRFDE